MKYSTQHNTQRLMAFLCTISSFPFEIFCYCQPFFSLSFSLERRIGLLSFRLPSVHTEHIFAACIRLSYCHLFISPIGWNVRFQMIPPRNCTICAVQQQQQQRQQQCSLNPTVNYCCFCCCLNSFSFFSFLLLSFFRFLHFVFISSTTISSFLSFRVVSLLKFTAIRCSHTDTHFHLNKTDGM